MDDICKYGSRTNDFQILGQLSFLQLQTLLVFSLLKSSGSKSTGWFEQQVELTLHVVRQTYLCSAHTAHSEGHRPRMHTR